MLYSYLKVILRNFLSDRLYTMIIVVGLAIGIAVTLIVTQYVCFELSFDKQYKDYDRIYYTYMNWQDGEKAYDKECHPAVGPLIKRSIPEVESLIRIIPAGLTRGDEWVLQREKDGTMVDHGRINHMYAADPEIFDFLAIPLLAGDAKTALADPHSLVITRSIANKFFPGESPIGKVMKVVLLDFTVAGIVADPDPNSSLQYSVFFSMNFWTGLGDGRELDESWLFPEWRTFIKLNPGADAVSVEKKINEAAAPHLTQLQKDYNISESIHLYPFRDFHFYKPFNSAGASPVVFTGDKRIMGFFAVVALLILIICWANYINLTIARALGRAKEVGLRKVSGASRANLVLQFLWEFLLLNLFSLFVAFTLTQWVFDSFAAAIGSRAVWMLWKEPLFWLAVLVFIILSTLASGIYPAFVMSNYNPVKVLKGNFSRSHSGMKLRKALVLIQFGLSAFLLMSIYVISRQLFFMQNKDLGMSIEQVLVTRLDDLDSKLNPNVAFQQWKIKIQERDDVKSGSAISNYPGETESRNQQYYPLEDPQRTTFLETNIISEDYFNVMSIPLLYGRTFRDDNPSDTSRVIINETGARQLGFDNPESIVGRPIVFSNDKIKFEVVGVVKDFTASLKKPSYGSIFHKQFHYLGTNYFVLRLSTANIRSTLSDLESEWRDLFHSPFDSFFLDSYFDTFYREEKQFAGVFGFFSVVGVVITCMGLFGLSMYNTGSRAKEIGIRKSLGSSSSSIMWLFSREYLKLVLTAGIVCIPVGAWLLTGWLETYPHRIEFGVDFLIVPLVLVILVAQLTVGYQTYKAAHANPVNSLRNN